MTPEDKTTTPVWSEGVCGDGAIILRDGEPVSISNALAALNAAAVQAADLPSRMVRINTVITDLQQIGRSFGNTCVYIRRGGMSWGAVALNRRDDDEKHGAFDIQAQHDRDMAQRVGQVERLLERIRELEGRK